MGTKQGTEELVFNRIPKLTGGIFLVPLIEGRPVYDKAETERGPGSSHT
jgi:hypothetical protein